MSTITYDNYISLDVEYGNNEHKSLMIYPDSVPEKIAFYFCKENNLNYNSLQTLTNEIKNIQESSARYYSSRVSKGITDKNLNSKSKANNINNNSNKISSINAINVQQDQIKKSNSNNSINYQKQIFKKKTFDYGITKLSKEQTPSNNTVATDNNNSRIKKSKTNNKSTQHDNDNNNSTENDLGEESLINFGERLYQKGIKMKEHTSINLNKKKVTLQQKEIENNSFKPSINQIPYSILYKRTSSYKACNDPTIILNYRTLKESKIEKLKNKIKEDNNKDSNDEYSFKPKINKRSIQIAKTQPNQKRYDKLYNDKNKKQINLLKLDRKIYDKNSMFKPKINNNIKFYCSHLPFEERLKEQQNKRNIKRNQLIQKISCANNCYFHPKIINKSFNNGGDQLIKRYETDVFSNLFSKADYYRIKKEIIANNYYNVLNNKSNQQYTNEKSNEILQRKKISIFKELFMLMDKNKIQLITKDNCDTSNIPENILKIFDLVLTELITEQYTLTENEFISVCESLYNSLETTEKNELLAFGNKKKKNINEYKTQFSFHPKINKKYKYSKSKSYDKYYINMNYSIPIIRTEPNVFDGNYVEMQK